MAPTTRQPVWQLVKNIGDVSPIEYGGVFVYHDTTGVYGDEMEVLFSPDDDDAPEGWAAYRVCLDRLKMISDPETSAVYLVPFAYDPTWPHPVAKYDEWFHSDLAHVAESLGNGTTVDDLRADLCSSDPITRAFAYQAIGGYHGYENFDTDPFVSHSRDEVEARYAEEIGA
jgi:hypothetical protein